jgi:hypothetical protein
MAQGVLFSPLGAAVASLSCFRAAPGRQKNILAEAKRMTDETKNDEGTQDGATGAGDAETTDGKVGDTGAREMGDLTGATSTHAGAGGVMDNTGGTGTAPTEG